MPYVKSLRDILVTSTLGHMVRVAAQKPTYIPPEILENAQGVGCIECDKDGKLLIDLKSLEEIPVDSVPKLTEQERNDPAKRAEVIVQAVAKVYQANVKADFNAENLPRVKAVEALTGFPTSAAEVAAAVEQYHAK